MTQGFIFNTDKCVGCSACTAACVLENKWDFKPRLIYSFNSEAITPLTPVNISLACNHCKEAVCMKGCPTASYFREPLTGAIVIDDSKCIGCRYCQWNCPYDAPKFNREKRIIGKCNLCYQALYEDRLPACAVACPTGALKFGKLSETTLGDSPGWFPDKNLAPALEFSGKQNINPLRIIPEKIFAPESDLPDNNVRPLTEDWSLIGFSFLVTLSVSTLISSFIKGVFPDLVIFIVLTFMAGFISLFHTGKMMRSWRSLGNLKTSPLSREIAGFVLYCSVSLVAVSLELPSLLIVSSAIGLFLLIMIDGVYIFADRRKSVLIHSGQTFLSSLLIISFLTQSVIPFTFIAVIKIVTSVYKLHVNRITGTGFGIRFLRIAVLLLTGISLITGFSFPDPVIVSLFLSGELLDRILFYIDFKPLNIKTLLLNNLILNKYEKKRG
jgi:Fe-S-cluster-containing dehydrogenase component